MQTISVPYRCSEEGTGFILKLRRIYSAAVRTAYANGMCEAGRLLPEKELRHLVKARFAGGAADAWILHCATLEGREARKRVPSGKLVFGGRHQLLRRNDGLIGKAEFRSRRLLPLASRGDKLFKGNRHFRLAPDGRRCSLQMYKHRIELLLSSMSGNAGEILRQVAELAAAKQINVMFRIDDAHLHITIDPMDLPHHPERRVPVAALTGRAVGIDLNPSWIGVSAVQNRTDPAVLEHTELLEAFLVQINADRDASPETVRELLARTATRIVSLARKHRVGVIVLEKGLGKLRGGGKNLVANRLLNYWARTIFGHLITRKARLAGIKLTEVWGGYSTTIGNLAFAAPDACAAAAEIGRRGIARSAGIKDSLPVIGSEVVSGRWKDQEPPNAALLRRAQSWGKLHREIKAAKLGVRRPHPDVRGDRLGHVVHRLGLKHRPGLIYRSTLGRQTQTMTVYGTSA